MELTNHTKQRRKPPIDLSTMVYGKVPPQATDIEQAILGAILMVPAVLDIISEFLVPEAFYRDAHQRVYRAFLSLRNRYLPIDKLTVIEELKKSEELDIVGGPFFITTLDKNVSDTGNIEAHARIVLQKFIQRELIRTSGETIGDAYEDSTDVFDLIDDAEAKLSGIVNYITRGSYQTADNLVLKTIERVDFLRANKGNLTGVPTGYALLDRLTNGWQPTDLIIIAARPSVGKTAFALNLARNAIISKIKPTSVAFFSLEMSAGQCIQRLVAMESGIDLDKISNGRMDEQEYKRFIKACDIVAGMKIFIDDTAALNVIEFRSRVRRFVNKNKVGLVIIDYLQLMSGRNEKTNNREQEISNISRNIKALAKELNVPIIALSQLSREVENRKPPIPQLSDLRESGAIEQDADMVMFLTRPSYQKDEKEIDPAIANDAEAWIKKHRNGPLSKLLFKTVFSIQSWFDLRQFEEYEHRANGFIPLSNAEAFFNPSNIGDEKSDPGF